MNNMRRMWINQPSVLQNCHVLHVLHGFNVLVDLTGNDTYVTVYFTEGDVISAVVPRISLAEGWK